MLTVVAERRVRGALERTYLLRRAASVISLDELAKMTPDEHRAAFAGFVAGLLSDFDRYVEREDIDYLRDTIGYRMAAMWLNDAELAEFVHDIARITQPHLANAPEPDRQRHILATVMMPAPERSTE